MLMAIVAGVLSTAHAEDPSRPLQVRTAGDQYYVALHDRELRAEDFARLVQDTETAERIRDNQRSTIRMGTVGWVGGGLATLVGAGMASGGYETAGAAVSLTGLGMLGLGTAGFIQQQRRNSTPSNYWTEAEAARLAETWQPARKTIAPPPPNPPAPPVAMPVPPPTQVLPTPPPTHTTVTPPAPPPAVEARPLPTEGVAAPPAPARPPPSAVGPAAPQPAPTVVAPPPPPIIVAPAPSPTEPDPAPSGEEAPASE